MGGTMMQRVPAIEPISAIKHRHNDVLRRLADGPIVLTRNAEPVAVLVSPVEWNRWLTEHEALQEELTALKTQPR